MTRAAAGIVTTEMVIFEWLDAASIRGSARIGAGALNTALPHSRLSRPVEFALLYASILPNTGCNLRLDRCIRWPNPSIYLPRPFAQ
jgi:hypothetical protein